MLSGYRIWHGCGAAYACFLFDFYAHPKNALSYKTRNGARIGDLFMSLIYTCQLNRANPFDYLTRLQRHSDPLEAWPQRWMP
jgi:transposase